MVVVGEYTQKDQAQFCVFLTLIPTIKATDLSHNVSFVDFVLKLSTKTWFTVCLILTWVSRSTAVLFTQFKKPADTLYLVLLYQQKYYFDLGHV